MLSENAEGQFQEEGFELLQHSFITTQSIISEDIKRQITLLATQKKLVLFTSASAVISVLEQLGSTKPDWQFYSISGSTKDAIVRYWGAEKILGFGNDALEILEKMKNETPQEIIFFCGNKRLDTLPTTLAERGFTVKEIVVYGTVFNPQNFKNNFDALMFYSPSGVESYLSENNIAEATVLFSIGKTTANALHQKVNNEVIISAQPDKNILVQTVIDFYKKHKL